MAWTPAFVLRAMVLAVVVAVGAACCNFLWPAAAPVAWMKAPGGAGQFIISRAAFEANPKLYFELLRSVGVKAAAAAFAA